MHHNGEKRVRRGRLGFRAVGRGVARINGPAYSAPFAARRRGKRSCYSGPLCEMRGSAPSGRPKCVMGAARDGRQEGRPATFGVAGESFGDC